MKSLLIIPFLVLRAGCLFAQIPINDQSIIYQQERMVFKQWDKNKFTPKPGFLYTNPLYWLTWAWHSDYKNKDLRPLGPAGMQTQRLALVAAMQNTDNAYRLEADTVRNTSLTEISNYSGLLSDADPLWLLYYSKAFNGLLNENPDNALNDVSADVRTYLDISGIFNWHREEAAGITERLNTARTTTLDRGARILSYHRLLGEYRQLQASWDAQKKQAAGFLRLQQAAKKVRTPDRSAPVSGYRTDEQIADDILKTSKL